MGSIQALRSWALSARANEDTDVQISGFLGGVNKSLGRQISGIIDQLQGVIGERTKAYNGLVASITRNIDGKGGIAEKAILGTFAGIRTMFSVARLVINPSDGAALVKSIVDLGGSLISNGLNAASIRASVGAAIYDYEKMASQLGYFQVNSTPLNPSPPSQLDASGYNTGASRFLDMRDALMPRYNQVKVAGNYEYHAQRGFVGTLRRN